ncbi:DUF488 family protein [Methylocapsa polymorpha]|uniref:DUF488 family protein n=1 Tax=Methylocapsa polymorpha TaxID=3080828 RepID=A0ABZ0HY91_9HYPH|nr:DUF488 family protein [Methylocapsa sp. RX1]
METIRIKRAYDPPQPEDGARILVDRLWPRGLARDVASIDAWAKPVAPSDALRRWFGHDPAKWPEFRRRYRDELAHNPAFLDLQGMVRSNAVTTLLFAAKDKERNNAVVLREALSEAMKR